MKGEERMMKGEERSRDERREKLITHGSGDLMT